LVNFVWKFASPRLAFENIKPLENDILGGI
jgi:hypothetical protein